MSCGTSEILGTPAIQFPNIEPLPPLSTLEPQGFFDLTLPVDEFVLVRDLGGDTGGFSALSMDEDGGTGGIGGGGRKKDPPSAQEWDEALSSGSEGEYDSDLRPAVAAMEAALRKIESGEKTDGNLGILFNSLSLIGGVDDRNKKRDLKRFELMTGIALRSVKKLRGHPAHEDALHYATVALSHRAFLLKLLKRGKAERESVDRVWIRVEIESRALAKAKEEKRWDDAWQLYFAAAKFGHRILPKIREVVPRRNIPRGAKVDHKDPFSVLLPKRHWYERRQSIWDKTGNLTEPLILVTYLLDQASSAARKAKDKKGQADIARFKGSLLN